VRRHLATACTLCVTAYPWWNVGAQPLMVVHGHIVSTLPSPANPFVSVVAASANTRMRIVRGINGPWLIARMGRQLRSSGRHGRILRSVMLAYAVSDVAVDEVRGLVYGATYGTSFRLERDSPVLPDSALVTVFSLADGHVLRRLGRPRTFGGGVAALLANQVRLALNAAGDLYMFWPNDGALARVAQQDGRVIDLGRLPSLAVAVPPAEHQLRGVPVPAVDLPIIVRDVTTDADGHTLVLAEGPAHETVVSVLASSAPYVCSIRVPVTMTRLLPAEDRVISGTLSDSDHVAHRFAYACAWPKHA
jgi:hypothetical protein